MKTFSFRITATENGNFSWIADYDFDYRTREQAIKGAQYSAENFSLRVKNPALEKTEDGAVLFFTDNRGNRCRYEYKAN